MTQEEKAKAYDEALEKAKELLDSPRTWLQYTLWDRPDYQSFRFI